MNEPIKEAEDLARRILACEANESDPAQAHVASRAIEKLRHYLTKFIGSAGFQALLARAVALATKEVAWLASVQVKANGDLTGFDEAVRAQTADDASIGQMALLTQLLALLFTIIGRTVTLHMVQEIWPDVRPDDLKSSAKETT